MGLPEPLTSPKATNQPVPIWSLWWRHSGRPVSPARSIPRGQWRGGHRWWRHQHLRSDYFFYSFPQKNWGYGEEKKPFDSSSFQSFISNWWFLSLGRPMSKRSHGFRPLEAINSQWLISTSLLHNRRKRSKITILIHFSFIHFFLALDCRSLWHASTSPL